MEFKSQYLQAMQDQAPKMLAALHRHGRLEQHLQQKSVEAHAMLRDLLKKHPDPSLAQQREAEEIVRQTLIEFPPEKLDPENAEPPDDLPTPRSGGRTTSSSRGP